MAARQRILMCVTGAEHGGAQTIIGELIAGLSHRFEFHLACGRPGPLIGWALAHGATVHRLAHLAWGMSPRHDLNGIAEMRRLIRVVQPHLLHSHTTKAGIVARYAARREGIPVVHTAHGWNFTRGAGAARRVSSWLTERSLRCATSALVCVSRHDRRSAIRSLGYAPARVRLIYPGVADHNTRRADAMDLHAGHTSNSHALHVVCVARFSPQKDQITLLHALAQRRSLNLRATFVGDGALLPMCRALAEKLGLNDRVQFLGALDQAAVAAILTTASLAVLTSHFEGLPISLIEAQRHGLPSIASDVGGVSEVVGQDTGILVRPMHPDAVADALLRLSNDPTLRQRLGAAARTSYLNRFRPEAMCERHARLYASVTM